MSTERLYTPELLALAVSLAEFPPNAELPLHGESRSVSCGSTLAMDVATDAGGAIANLGMKVQACAIGQSAAAIFARSAEGVTLAEVASALAGLEAWLSGEGGQPDWPGFEPLLPVREFPGRHGALLLPWKAASAALSTAPACG